MNQPDDFDPGLRDRLSSAIGAEPPMESLPHDDLARGRRLDRRRRWTAVGAAATVVPALSLGAYAVAGGFSGAAGTGPTTVQMAPADGGESTSPGDPQGTLTADCSSDVSGSTDGSAGLSPARSSGSGHSHGSFSVGPARGFKPGSGNYPGNGLQTAAAPVGPGSQTGNGSVVPDSSADPTTPDCSVVSSGDISSPDVDRVTEALNRHVDPNGTHAGMTIAGGSVENPDSNGPSGIYAGYEWTDGTGTGMVSLSVEDPSVGNGDSCADPSAVNGPEVTCQTQTLPDGTTVLVGHGQQNGAERITVRYVRPDGTIVWATADQATEQWWTDQTGAPPLTSPPVSVDQLIDLVRDPDVRL